MTLKGGRNARNQIVTRISLITLVPFDVETTKFGRITCVGRGVFLRGQPRPYHKGAGPSASQSFYSLLFMYTPFDAELPNLVWWHIWGSGLFLGGQPSAHSKEAGSQKLPALPNFGVPLYLCIHPLSQNYQIWCGNTCGGGACILRSATPPIPRKRSSKALQFWGSRIYAYTI